MSSEKAEQQAIDMARLGFRDAGGDITPEMETLLRSMFRVGVIAGAQLARDDE